uniref:Uncharacterized protein n=1 Tax=Brassica oleracea TaxID=3712 RepID=A0A3P6DSA2_BRAOL|nr:unnamed protein product [Brassica oleracea]
MKREGRQHGVVRTLMVLPSELNPRPAKLFVNRFDSPPAFGVFTKVPSKPTNHSKFTGRCERSKCSDCHASPAKKSANKSKGRRKEQAMASWTEDKPHCLVRSDLSGEDYEALVVSSSISGETTKMVCDKCEKKLSKVIVPDKWKDGARNVTEGGGRKINENKLLSKKNRWTPYGTATTKCMICKQQVHQDGKYCHTCAYSKGVCAMCGKQVLDTKMYKQSNV